LYGNQGIKFPKQNQVVAYIANFWSLQ